ncbi:hypothetical protein ISN45_Aa02g026010 [Arabidopsis thaliana x Arabidopsis arenosa]|uniref:Transmembrane protein n=1 Tax=Arabidopsis thaliana x Arabidopsis arenosa TaxID=1240361 RepID=A0A8T2BKK9_9BRAS|nr:hypothetical protein ISN45_Aa02g026010 [Arabidopsis thaliana x Arabidopsis arenosa]
MLMVLGDGFQRLFGLCDLLASCRPPYLHPDLSFWLSFYRAFVFVSLPLFELVILSGWSLWLEICSHMSSRLFALSLREFVFLAFGIWAIIGCPTVLCRAVKMGCPRPLARSKIDHFSYGQITSMSIIAHVHYSPCPLTPMSKWAVHWCPQKQIIKTQKSAKVSNSIQKSKINIQINNKVSHPKKSPEKSLEKSPKL